MLCRNLLLFVGGLIGLLVCKFSGVDPSLLVLFGAMAGLPLFLDSPSEFGGDTAPPSMEAPPEPHLQYLKPEDLEWLESQLRPTKGDQ